MTQNLTPVLGQVSKDKGIEQSVLVDAIEASILTAAKKVFGYERMLEAHYDENLGQVELFQYMEVVALIDDGETQISLETGKLVDDGVEVGDELGFQIFYLEEHADRAREEDTKYGDILNIKTQRNSFGRIAAQTAKQVIIQRVREAERDIVYNEYKDRQNEIVTGIARRFERGDVIVDLGRAEAVLSVREQMPRESFRAGDRVQAYVKEVSQEAKGPQIRLSRTDTGLIKKLFEMEVPEIYEGIVRIVNVAREPGERTKIAVASSDTDVDPVGACVGMKGSRVQAVVQELRGEKIDIVPWSSDIAKFVCHAIAPADVSRVLIDEDTNTIELIVGDDQLSLAIGRRGQNVRLASQLVGWKIEIHSETKINAIMEEIKANLMALELGGLDESTIDYLFKLGFHSPENLLNARAEELTMIPGITDEIVESIRTVAGKIKDGSEEAAVAAHKQEIAAAPVQPAVELPHDREALRLQMVSGLSAGLLVALSDNGFETVESIGQCSNLAGLAAVNSIGLKKARSIKASCMKYLEEEIAEGGFEAMMDDVDLSDDLTPEVESDDSTEMEIVEAIAATEAANEEEPISAELDADAADAAAADADAADADADADADSKGE